jgi:hypothetical protein
MSNRVGAEVESSSCSNHYSTLILMTIFVESRATEINLPNAKRVEGLEALTGADMMISRLTLPATTRALILKHLYESALLIQCKFGEDLAASVGDRLNDSLARMISMTRRTALHWLLFVGTLACDFDGIAFIDGHKTHVGMKFDTIDGAIVGWLARGGVYYSLSRKGLLAPWCEDMERRLGQYNAEQYKYILSKPEFPDDLPSVHDDALQIPIRVKDARRALIGFNGLGVELVNRLWEFCGDYKSVMQLLTDPDSAGKVEGIGKGTIASIRKQCGLQDGDEPLQSYSANGSKQ